MSVRHNNDPERKRHAIELLDLCDAYGEVFSGKRGALVLADLEARGFIHQLSFDPEPSRAAFNEGRRSLVMHVQYMMSPKARESALMAIQPETKNGDAENV